MENLIEQQIINILARNQSDAKTGADGVYESIVCVSSDMYEEVAKQVASFIQAITDKENQPNQYGIIPPQQ